MAIQVDGTKRLTWWQIVSPHLRESAKDFRWAFRQIRLGWKVGLCHLRANHTTLARADQFCHSAWMAFRRRGASPVESSAVLGFGDALRIARVCHDYNGGYHTDGAHEIYHHGIQTVINALESGSEKGTGRYADRGTMENRSREAQRPSSATRPPGRCADLRLMANKQNAEAGFAGSTCSASSRSEHLAWCKKRALEYCDLGDVNQAFASMSSDLGKHPETANHAAIKLGMMLLMAGHLS